MVDLRVNLPGSEKDQPKFNYSSPVEAPGAMKVAAKKSGTASLIEGVAAIGGGLVDIVDKTFQGIAESETERAVDQVREEFAVNGDLYGGRDITNDPQTTPEIEKSLKYAREINQGYMAGTIKDSNYWARLDSISRQLRTRYPGYRDYIDAKMSSMVGGTPANRLREQLAEEARAAARQNAEQSPLEKLRWSNLADLVKDGIQDRINPGWQKQIQDGTFDWEENMRVGAALRYSEYETKVKQNNINLLQDDAELAKANAKVEARKEATVYVNTAILGGTTAQGKKVGTMIADFKKMAAENKLPTGPELEQSLSNLNGLRLSITDGINNMLDGQWKDHPNQSYSNFLDGTERKEILENALAPITAMEQFLKGEDTGVLDRYATSLKYMTDGDSKRMAEVDDNIRMMMSVSKQIGPEGMGLLYQNSEVLTSIANTLSDSMISHLVTGKSDSVVQTIRTIRDSQGAGAKQLDQSVSLLKDRLISYLSSDSADVETFRTLSNSLFNDKENLLAMVSTEQGAKVLGQLTAPGVAKRMKEMTVYDPAIWKNYERWATKGFLYLNQSAMQTMKDVKVNRKFVDVVYDPKKMVFSQQTRKPTGSTILDTLGWDVLKGIQSVSEQYFGKQGKKAIDDLNLSFANFKAFAEEAGIDPVSITSQALAANGFDPDAPYEGPAIPTTLELGSMIAGAIVRSAQRSPNIELDPETEKILDGEPNDLSGAKNQDRLQ